jgi:hypothetical protein
MYKILPARNSLIKNNKNKLKNVINYKRKEKQLRFVELWVYLIIYKLFILLNFSIQKS